MRGRPLTARVNLPGGQSRLRQVILYVAERCYTAEFFGAIKLNKIIWRADFQSFAARRTPITGREYARQQFGPALREMLPVHREMLQDGAVRIERRDFGLDEFGRDVVERRTVALDRANMQHFSVEDISFIDESIAHYWKMTGEETSDESHGVAWKTRRNGDPMPYELALLSDEPLSKAQLQRIEDLILERGWMSE